MALNNALMLILGLFVLVTAYFQSVALMSFLIFILFVLLLMERRARQQAVRSLLRRYRGY